MTKTFNQEVQRHEIIFMGWLNRLFGERKPRADASVFKKTEAEDIVSEAPPNAPPVPPERLGLDGQYDESGLAKRVALALDDDPDMGDVDTVYIAQRGSTVVLKGKVPDKELLNRIATVARKVHGATGVETDQVDIG